MKQKYYIGFISLVLATLLVSCVHDYPTLTEDGSEGIDPTLVEVNTEVTLDLELLPLQIVTNKARSGTTKAGEGADFRRRFIVEAWRDGKPEARQVTVMEESDESNQAISLPIHLKLHAVEYTLAVWTDYVAAGTDTDLYYDTKDLQYVACTDPYTGSTDYRDCLYGTTALDLRQYREEWNAKVQIKVDMIRPLAKYELVATDVKDFLRKTKKQREGEDGTFTITFSYGFYLPTVFNVLTGKPADSRTGIAYTIPLTVPDDGTEECRIGTDFVFVNGAESFVKLSMEIRDGGGNVISRTVGLEVPYRRGHLTTVRARFLTNEMQGGVDIDPDFDGDIDIDLDGLLH